MDGAEAIVVYSDDDVEAAPGHAETAQSQPSFSFPAAGETHNSAVALENPFAPRVTLSAAATTPHRTPSSVRASIAGAASRSSTTQPLERTRHQADLSPRHASKSSKKKKARTEPPPTAARSSTCRMRVRPAVVLPRSLHQMATRYLPAQWPSKVPNLRTNFNPNGIVMPFTPLFGKCGCSTPCRQETCRNAELGVFCAPNCCLFFGRCGNGLALSEDIMLATDSATEQLAVVATQHIDEGVILGESLGRLTLEKPRKQRTLQRGYRFVMHEAPRDCGRWKACIDADAFGSLMRFVNHSCTPACQFTELGNELEHTVAVTTTRPIEAGAEVAVD